MTPVQIVLLTIAVLTVVEGFVVAIDPKWAKSITHRLTKKKSILRTLGIVEILIGALLFLIAINN